MVRIKAKNLNEAKKKAIDRYGIDIKLSSGRLESKPKSKRGLREYRFEFKEAHKPGKVIKISKGKKYSHDHHNTGPQDSKRPALPPGKRVSKNGSVYYEYRPNRTDMPVTRRFKKVKDRKKKKKKRKR